MHPILSKYVRDHKDWLAGKGGTRLELVEWAGINLDLKSKDLSSSELVRCTIQDSCFYKTIFRKAGLTMSDLERSDFRKACFQYAKMSKSYWVDCNLSGADLRGANLSESTFIRLNFSKANLEGVDLSGAALDCCDFTGANLANANFTGADLSQVFLDDANLKGTCLDPQGKFKPPTKGEVEEGGLIIKGGFVYGYRTKLSQHHGMAKYHPGHCYVPRYFSTCAETGCHPGLYLSSMGYLKSAYPGESIVEVRTKLKYLLKVRKKWRCKWLEVVRDVPRDEQEKW